MLCYLSGTWACRLQSSAIANCRRGPDWWRRNREWIRCAGAWRKRLQHCGDGNVARLFRTGPTRARAEAHVRSRAKKRPNDRRDAGDGLPPGRGNIVLSVRHMGGPGQKPSSTATAIGSYRDVPPWAGLVAPKPRMDSMRWRVAKTSSALRRRERCAAVPERPDSRARRSSRSFSGSDASE